jgi:hypothetical protein
MTLELSATAIATLLQDRAARVAFRVLLPPNAVVAGGDRCITIQEEQLNVDPNNINKPWLDDAAKALMKGTIGGTGNFFLGKWLACCHRIQKNVGGYVPVSILLGFCKAALFPGLPSFKYVLCVC